MFPEIKRGIKNFILEEEGSISKQSVLRIGSALLFSSVGLSKSVLGSCGCGCGCAAGNGGGGGGSGAGAAGCSGSAGCAGTGTGTEAGGSGSTLVCDYGALSCGCAA